MSFGLEHLANPLVGGDFLTSILELFMGGRERNALQSDPGILNLINNRIGDYNSENAFDPATGQFNAGSPFGDAASGYGGAYGTGPNGNPLSPFQGNTRYNLTAMGNTQGGLDTGISNLAQAAEVGGVSAPQGFDLGVGSLGLDPNAVQGVNQDVRNRPTPLSPIEAPDDLLNQWLGSFAVGTQSVPRDGLALLHQGEAVVPAAQNPGALPAGVAGPPLANTGGTPVPPSNGGGPSMGNAGLMGGGAPANTGGTPVPPSYFGLSPGLSPAVQQQIVSRGQEQNDLGYQALQRDLRNQGPQGGGGPTDRRVFDAGVANLTANSGLQRDVGIQAEQQRFGDSLAANDQLLSRFLGEGQLGLANRQQGLSEELGRGGLALQGELGRGGLANESRGLDIQSMLAQLQGELGRGGLANESRGLDIQQLLGQGGLDLQGELGRGSLANESRGLTIQQMLGQGGLANESRGLDLQQLLGLGSQENERRGQDIQQGLGEGGLSNERRGQDINEALSNRGMDIQDFLSQLQNDIQRGGLQLDQGQFGRGLANDAFDQYQFGVNRNDNLAQQDYQNRFNDTAYQQQTEQGDDLLGLLSQFAGQSTDESSQPWHPIADFINSLFNRG